jgi:glucose-6-phosphate dehydrogenase assembly protein OpcA
MEKPVVHRVTRAAAPETIEADLNRLWRDLGRDTPSVRALMSNLVVFHDAAGNESLDLDEPVASDPVLEVARRHPSRVIVLVHTRCDGERPPAAATVAILTFVSSRERYSVEHIVIRSSCAEQSLPSIVRRLTLGDLPTSIWWTEDLSQRPPLDTLVSIGRQFVYDSRRWRDVRAGLATIHRILAGEHAPDVVDLNWRRLRPIRQAIIHSVQLGIPIATTEFRVLHRPGDEALGWLLVGWLLSSLEHAGDPPRFTVKEWRNHDVLSARIEGLSGRTITAVMNHHHVTVTDTAAPSSFVLPLPRETDAEGLATELGTLGHDVALIETIRAAYGRFGPA